MRDPWDNRIDAYETLGLTEESTRQQVHQKYTSLLIRRTIPQKELVEARELLARTEKRVLYDLYRYPFAFSQMEVETPQPLDIQTTSIESLQMPPVEIQLKADRLIGLIEINWEDTEEQELKIVESLNLAELPMTPFQLDV